MKKLFLTALIGLGSITYANVNAVVSIVPQKTFLEKIGGDKVNVSLMVKPGNSPHTYEPKPSQMRNISKADIYFTIDVEFEHNWLAKFQNQNKSMVVKYMGENITKMEMEEHSHHDEHEGHNEHKEHEGHDDHDEHKDHDDHAKESHNEDDHDEEGKDPHIWTSPTNAKIIANNIFNELVRLDLKNVAYYKANLDSFLKEINQTDKTIKELLKNTPKKTKFMVFHPAWGYFAKEYNLEQLAIESGGKNPKPKQIAHLIDEAKEENVKAVFTAPEFSISTAQQIAKEVGVPVIQVSPLNPKWSENLINLAKALSTK
jgi:zinc transport system substrate-binding protein